MNAQKRNKLILGIILGIVLIGGFFFLIEFIDIKLIEVLKER